MIINIVNNQLNGVTGTGKYVGSDSHSLLGDLDWSSADSIEIPNSVSPISSLPGHISIDTSIANYTPLPQIRSSSETLNCISVPSADLTANDGDIIVYDSASQKFTFSTPSVGGGSAIVGYAFAEFTIDALITSTSYVSTGITVNYTPSSASNTLLIEATMEGFTQNTGGTLSERYSFFRLRRTTAIPVTLAEQEVGIDLSVNTSSNRSALYTASLFSTESSADTNVHTYLVECRLPVSNLESRIDLDDYKGIISVTEVTT